MASIVFAVLLAILLDSVKEGMLFKLQENVVSFYSGAVQVHKKGYWDEKTLDNTFASNDSLLIKVNASSGVRSAVARLESFALAASDHYTRGCMIVGIEPDEEVKVTSLDEKISDGEYLSKEDHSVLLAQGLAEYLRLNVGDTLVIIGQGYHGVSAAGKYPIKGLLKFASPDLNKSIVYLPLRLAQQLFGAPNLVTALVLDIENVNDAELIERNLNQTLSSEYEVMGWKKLMPELHQIIEGERSENVIFLAVLYMLIAFGIFGTVLMMTVERQYEFGVLVAIGMRKLKLSSVVIMENIIISILGAMAGTVLSVPTVFYFYKFPIRISGELEKAYENFGFEPIFYFSVEPIIFYRQALIVLIIALVLSIYPLFKITRLEPVAAMRDT
ncbi:MAG: ABC transporter permease [Cyclobacteriaceae bacterium]